MSDKSLSKKYLSKESLMQLIIHKNDSATCSKENEKNHASKVWSRFTTIFVHKILKNHVMCNYCMSLIVYKHSTGTGGMQKRIECCLNKSLSTDERDEKKLLHILIKQKTSQAMFLRKLKIN